MAPHGADSAARTERPMFPLGSPLLPSAVLPLHIFEPRYRALARRCTDHEEPFGVVMIERGSEVGGGDVRSDVGCLATISEHQELPDGRWVMLATGGPRVRVFRMAAGRSLSAGPHRGLA